MPWVTLTVNERMAEDQRRALLDAVHASLVSVGVPQADRFQRVMALPGHAFIFDSHYPGTDTQAPGRDERFAVVEVLWSVGRSVKIKRQFLQHLHGALLAQGLDPEQLMLVFKETAWENWSFAGTRLLHA
jgi:phenylpyruvate tautomerase PptA (4-oxalocrotonate tautomerase family)